MTVEYFWSWGIIYYYILGGNLWIQKKNTGNILKKLMIL